MISFVTSPSASSVSPEHVSAYPPQLPIPRSSLVVRISESNISSIKLFERVGFRVVKRVEVFGEVEMRWTDRN
jgi:L-amino acid N-acyltransferase YncA